MEYPDYVKIGLTNFLKELPIEENSSDWEAIQAAISLLYFPDSLKKGAHVFISSRYQAREEGCHYIKEMAIKIYTHKIVIRRKHNEYNSACDINKKETYRYIYPDEKYCAVDFTNVMSDLSDLFVLDYTIDDSDPSGIMINSSNFRIETNLLKKK